MKLFIHAVAAGFPPGSLAATLRLPHIMLGRSPERHTNITTAATGAGRIGRNGGSTSSNDSAARTCAICVRVVVALSRHAGSQYRAPSKEELRAFGASG